MIFAHNKKFVPRLLVLWMVLGGFVPSEVAAQTCADIAAGLLGGKVGNRATHVSDLVFLRSEARSRSEFLVDARKFLKSEVANPVAKEKTSVQHQEDLLAAIVNTKDAKIDREAMELGIIDSDRGKLASYVELLTKPSEKSDRLLDTLTGRVDTPSSRALRELLVEGGHGDRTLLNRQLTNTELREVMQSVGGLTGFLHDFPGIADAITLHERGLINSTQFKAQVGANLFHNGPSEGFWKVMTDIIVPGSISRSTHPAAQKFFDNTVYRGGEGQLVYPRPMTAEGILHTTVDRLSQATRGGVVKIYHEIVSFTPPLKAFADLVLNNPGQSIAQLQVLASHIRDRSQQGQLEPATSRSLQAQVTEAMARVQRFAAGMREQIGNLGDVGATVAAKDGPIEIVLAGRKFSRDALATPEAQREFIDFAEAVMRRVEASTGGDPLRAL